MVNGKELAPREAEFAEVNKALAPSGAGANLHALAAYWASEQRPRFKRRYKGAIGPGKAGAYKPKDDDGLRAWVENERELVVQINPTHADFFMHYDKKEDVVHFIVNGQAAIVPQHWLRTISHNMKQIRAREGHRPLLGPPPPQSRTLLGGLRYRLRALREAVLPTPFPPPPQPVDASIAREMEKIARLQGGEVGLLEGPQQE